MQQFEQSEISSKHIQLLKINDSCMKIIQQWKISGMFRGKSQRKLTVYEMNLLTGTV